MSQRFRSKTDGMNRRRPLWYCADCGAGRTDKFTVCLSCESTNIYYFASQAEFRRYRDLKLLARAGRISDLQVQPSYPIEINGKKVTTYRADFIYTDSDGKAVVEDVKGVETDVFKLKKKLVEAFYGFTIQLIKAA